MSTEEKLPAMEVVRRGLEAATQNDEETVRKYLSEDIVYDLVNMKKNHCRTWTGLDNYFHMCRMPVESTNGTFKFEIFNLYPAGDELVIAQGASSADYQGRQARRLNWAMVVRVVDQKVVQIVDVAETKLDEFWRPSKKAAA